MQNLYNKNNGITLVSLVITIIILLILAGVAIAQLAGNELFEKARLAKEEQRNAEIEENEKLSDYENKIGKYINSSREDESEINNLKKEIEQLKNINSYSTIEQVVGTWIDGKPVYKKTWDYGSTIHVSNTSWTDTQVSISENHIDHVIKAEATSEGSSTDDCCWALHAHTEDSVSNVNVLAPRANGSISCRYFTFYYTKTIDGVNE